MTETLTEDAQHTSKAFEEDLAELRALVAEMGGRAERAIRAAVEALTLRDEGRAAGVVADDARIDALAMEVERKAVTLIALRQPLADDLRAVLAALRISGLVARMGDCAKNIARRVPLLSDHVVFEQARIVPHMEEAVSDMVKGALDAFVARDAVRAAAVIAADDEVDEYYAAIFRGMVAHMGAHPHSITAGTHLLFIVQKLERIGDHATTIAGIVHFAVTGDYAAPADKRSAA